jgi:hypothetical protein
MPTAILRAVFRAKIRAKIEKGDDPMTKFLITALIAGALFGISFAGIDLLNPVTATAKAERAEIETQHTQAMNQLQEQLAQAKTEAEIQAVHNQQALEDAQYQHEVQLLGQDLMHRDIAFKTWMNVLSFMSYLLTAAGTILATIWAGKKILTSAQKSAVQAEVQATANPPSGTHPLSAPEKTPTNPWTSPAYRIQRIKAARQEEQKQRIDKKFVRIETFRDPARISKEEYKRRPLAGD